MSSDFGDWSHVDGTAPDTTGYQSPYANRGTDTMDNAIEDLKDFARGGGAIWSGANLAARGAFLDAARNASQDPIVKQELTQAGAQPLHVDPKFLGDVGKGIVDYYRGEYFDPLKREFLDKNAPPEGYLLPHFQKAPINTLLDLGLVGPLAKGPSLLGRAAVGTPFGRAAATRLVGALPETIQATRALPPFLRELTPVGQASLQASKTADLLQEAQNRYAAKIAQDRRDMERAGMGLTPEQRKLATIAHESTDPTVRQEVVKSADFMTEMQENLDDAREVLKSYFPGGKLKKGVTQQRINEAKRYISQLEARIKLQKGYDAIRAEAAKQAEFGAQAFHVPTAEQQLRRVLPRYLSEQLSAGNLMTAEQALADPRHVAAMRRMYGQLARTGQLPGYVPLIGKDAFERTQQRAFTTVLGSGHKRAGQNLLEKLGIKFGKGELKDLKDVPAAERPGYLKQLKETRAQVRQVLDREIRTVRNKMHELDIHKATLERTYRARRFEATEELVKKLMQQAPKEGAPGWVQVDLQAEFERAFPEVTKEGGQVPKFSHGNFGETHIMLPQHLADTLKQAIAGEAPRDIVDKWNSIYKGLLFLADPTFGPRLAMQTGVIQGSMVNHPKDVIRMMVASLIATNKKAGELLPDEMLLSHGGHSGDIKLIESGLNWAKVKDLKGRLDYGVHNWQRRSMAIFHLLKQSAKSPLEFRPMIADLFDTDAALTRLSQGLQTPQDIKALQGFMRQYAGDYSTLARVRRRAISKWLPLAPWISHAWELTKNLPVNHPYKTALTHTLGMMIVNKLDADEHGRVPVRDREGKLLLGPNGGIMYYQGPHMDLYESGGELVRDGIVAFQEGVSFISTGQGTGRELHIPSAITPAVSTLNAILTKTDPTTNLPYAEVNPDVQEVFVAGKLMYYNTSTGKMMESPRLSIPQAFARQTAPKQMGAMQRAVAYPNLPSPFTMPQHPAPRDRVAHPYGRVLHTGAPLKASPVENVLADFGQAATEKMPPAPRSQGRQAKIAQRRLQRQLGGR